MKRTLLTSALAIMALAASAQTQEVARVKGDGFSFINKNLTTEGKVLLYSSIGAEHYSSSELTEAEFTIYDDAFNKVKTFSYPFQKFTYKQIPMVGLADITKETPIPDRSWEDAVIQLENKSFASLDEFKEFMLGSYYIHNVEFFIDHNGNFAYHETAPDWRRYTKEYDYNSQKEIPMIEQHYYYFSKEDQTVYNAVIYLALEYDLANTTFQQEEGAEVLEYTNKERIDPPYLMDFDLGCNEDTKAGLSQNIFNKDDKFEFVVSSYKPTAAPTDEEAEIKVVGEENGKIKVRKYVQDKYYEPFTKVVNEDGQVVLNLPDFNFDKDADICRLNGKIYITGYERNPGEEKGSYVIYLLDETGTGITELARSKQVPNPKFFNLQGMKVDKSTKGFVIQKGGAKFFNK